MFARRYNMARVPFVVKPLIVGSRRWLIEQCDIHCSRYIRNRDGVSVLSGRGGVLQASHFFSRRYLNIRWDERNVHAMTPYENLRHNHDQRPYLNFMLHTYGEEVIAELNSLRRLLTKPTDEDLRELLAQYRRM